MIIGIAYTKSITQNKLDFPAMEITTRVNKRGARAKKYMSQKDHLQTPNTLYVYYIIINLNLDFIFVHVSNHIHLP